MGTLAALASLSTLALDCASAPPPSAPPPVAAPPPNVTAASNALGFDLYARLKRDSDNLILAPLSAAVALNMTSAGARGQTSAEMLGVLHMDPKHAAGAIASFGGVLGALNARDRTPGLALHVADRLWSRSGIAFKPDFLALLRDSYGSPLEMVDFAHAPGAARDTINQWIATQTHGHISEVLADDDVTPDTRLVLTNAVYFKGTWEKPFPPYATRPRAFGGRFDVPMMAQVEAFDYARDGDIQIIELPYRGDLSMVVVLPDGADDLPAVERKIALTYTAWVAALRTTYLGLWLPRWKTSSPLDLGTPLKAAGMRLAFTPAADFSGMSDAPLFIAKVVQEAFIDVNEFGTEGAAATAVEMLEGGLGPPTLFHADHPFLYLIRDRKTGAVLFLGRVASLGMNLEQ